jgi:chromosome partitioning protein
MIITLASFKGGVGKTTSAVHLACFLANKGATLLVDGDPNRSAIHWAKRGEMPYKTVDLMAAPKYMRNFEHVVIDTAARPTVEDLEALIEGCDLLILPTTPDALSMDALLQTVESLNRLADLPAGSYRILLTMVPSAPRKTGQQAREALIENGVPIFGQSIRAFAAYEKAALEGLPVFKIKDRNAGIAWREYQSVGNEL